MQGHKVELGFKSNFSNSQCGLLLLIITNNNRQYLLGIYAFQMHAAFYINYIILTSLL